MSNAEHRTTEKEIKEIWERLTKGEASIKSAHHRIDNLQEMSKSIKDLAISTAQIATETKKLREDYVKADERIEELEKKPVKRYETVVTAFLTALCSGVAGYLLALIIK
jgi:predicted nuclease with TOPRIM domain